MKNRIVKPLGYSDSELSFDLLKYRVQSTTWQTLRYRMGKTFNLNGVKLVELLEKLGIEGLDPRNNDQEIFFIVTKDGYETCPTDPGKPPLMEVLFGVSPQVALTEEDCERLFRARIERNNENGPSEEEGGRIIV